MSDVNDDRSAGRREGRLADPQRSPGTDDRLHPALAAAFGRIGLDQLAPDPPFDRSSDPQVLSEFLAAAEAGVQALNAALPDELEGDDDSLVVHRVEQIVGPDSNPLDLHIFQPRDSAGPLPGLIYIHGGGMVILKVDDPVHMRWCSELAKMGMVVVSAGFRNGWTPEGLNPFPAGLNDCSAALDWVHSNRAELGIDKLVVQGESGGGNLTLATALKAKKEGRLGQIDGIYASVPYISGGYGWPMERKLEELPSTVENDGYFINCAMMHILVAIYDPTDSNSENPLAWPYFAQPEDLEGLCPHVISVNELDPLRDEGVAYLRKLQRAGVPAVGRVNLGLVHAADMSMRGVIPAVYNDAVRDIYQFALSL